LLRTFISAFDNVFKTQFVYINVLICVCLSQV